MVRDNEGIVTTESPPERNSLSPVPPQAAIAAGMLVATAGLLLAALGFVTLFYSGLLPLGPNWVFRFDATWWASLFIIWGFLMAITSVMLAFQARWADVPVLSFALGSVLLMVVFCVNYPVWCLPIIILSLLGLSVVLASDRTLRRRR